MEHTHTHTFNGPLSGTTQWVAVASAGPYANLHIAPDKYPRQHPTTQFFYRPDALPATQPTVSKHWRNDIWMEINVHWIMSGLTWWMNVVTPTPIGQQSIVVTVSVCLSVICYVLPVLWMTSYLHISQGSSTWLPSWWKHSSHAALDLAIDGLATLKGCKAESN